MKNWDVGNTPNFGGEDPCFIEDLRKEVEAGFFLFFYRDGSQVVLCKHPEKPLRNIYDLSEDSETTGIFWSRDPLPSAIKIHSWELHGPGDQILIWWDHDLGDVLVDLMKDEDIDSEEHEQVYDLVWFYWVT